MPQRVAFLGPRGTYSEEAALKHAPDSELVPYPTFPHIGAAIESGEVDEALLPIENSVQGSVAENLDFLIAAKHTRIRGELLLPVRHCLMARPGVSMDSVAVVYSHPQALGQCRRYLAARLPDAEQVASVSTAAAVAELANSPRPAAAIAQRRLASVYGLQVLEEDIQDRRNNVTRFVILARATTSAPGATRHRSLSTSGAVTSPASSTPR